MIHKNKDALLYVKELVSKYINILNQLPNNDFYIKNSVLSALMVLRAQETIIEKPEENPYPILLNVLKHKICFYLNC